MRVVAHADAEVEAPARELVDQRRRLRVVERRGARRGSTIDVPSGIRSVVSASASQSPSPSPKLAQ